MSRIGKKGIQIPEKTEAKIAEGVFSVKGPKGSLERKFLPEISIVVGERNKSFS